MNWKNVYEVLPLEKTRCLAYCENNYGEFTWKGIVDVYFEPSIGWERCEDYNDKQVTVIFWTEMQAVDLPKDKAT